MENKWNLGLPAKWLMKHFEHTLFDTYLRKAIKDTNRALFNPNSPLARELEDTIRRCKDKKASIHKTLNYLMTKHKSWFRS